MNKIQKDQPLRGFRELVSDMLCMSGKTETINQNSKLFIDIVSYDKRLNPNSHIKIIELGNFATIDEFLETTNETKFSNFVKNSTHYFMLIANILRISGVKLFVRE